LTKDEALKLALKFVEDSECGTADLEAHIKEALAEPAPEQEPVAWFSTLPDGRLSIKIVGKPTEGNWEPLYTTPPQRTWVNLTNEEIGEIYRVGWANNMELARAIEQKLKEKNT
jgi:hypothetical protein